jgi:tetratricopeptide (TPR) repeat protein
MKNLHTALISLLATVCLALPAFAAEKFVELNPPATASKAATPIAQVESAAQPDILRSYLQVQEQLHATQLAIERNRQDAADIAARNAIALADRLSAIEKNQSEQRDREAEMNRWMLIGAGLLVAFGITAMLATSYMQLRTMNRFAEATLGAPLSQLASARDPRLLGQGAATEANTRLLGTIDRLEKRIRELESGKSTSAPVLEVVNGNGHTKSSESSGQMEVLLDKGQSLLNLGQAEAAAAIFDEALALDANHAEALIKKGAALEKLAKFDEAVACYDRAIAADSSVTIAYLYKGGVFNRQERYNEALACYEQALKTQEKAHAA